jgi:hypothetical protein
MQDHPHTDPAAPEQDWTRAYLLVLAVLAADVTLLWLLGRLYG